ncbi:respiration control sensor protein ArcB [Seminavis robusta]|uniref:histidine kinase n=1 Tax=Seminavis robusta TaxID=568900 RepID=A0A9N8H2T5_9STRA|nr:respiration control sensor protein ArcB [Seminavis robusta]|eukprot:Sro14_g010640.1 respiration control sensor protein ArcB (1022) ;mRNA; r:100319-103855
MTKALFDIERGDAEAPAASDPSKPKAPAPLFPVAPSAATTTSSSDSAPPPLFALPPSATSSRPAPLFALSTTTKDTSNSNSNPPPLFQINTNAPVATPKTSSAPAPLFSISNNSASNHDTKGRKESSCSTKSESEDQEMGPGKLDVLKKHSSFRNGNTKKAVMVLPSNLEKDLGKKKHSDYDSDDDGDDDRSDGAVNELAAKSSSSDGDSTHSSNSISSLAEQLRSRTGFIVALIVLLGVGASAAFLAVGLSGAQRQQTDQFQRSAKDLATSIQTTFERYVTAANYVHHYCRNRSFSRQDFRSIYELLIEDGLDFKAVQFDPNVTREERLEYEAEARAYYAEHYPHIDYQGFKGFDNGVKNGLVPTSERDFYFPIHYMEPVIGNEAAIDLDYYSHISRRRTLSHCFEYAEPAITDRLLLVKDPNAKSRCGSQDAESYGVVLMHPGVNISDPNGGQWPRDLSSIVICIPALLLRATHDHPSSSKVYIHDAHDSSGEAVFLGGVEVFGGETGQGELQYLNEIEIGDVKGHMHYQEHLQLTNKVWTITVVAASEVYKPTITFVVVGGTLVFLASVCLALWVYTNTQRHYKFNTMKAKVEGEKAALILENTRQAARAERELNDFIAHEVRNPVAAAMAACSFVKSAVNEKEPLVDPQKRADTREDVAVIHNSLQFINDLLRNMLDMHRASHKQLQVNFEPVDLYHDILQSTAGMIYQRDSKIKVIVECEQNLFVQSDNLRLKQVILNLSRNAVKFVNHGFIKLRGFVVDNEVRLAVEDSGIGIPAEKRDLLFAKFQESLDQLSQGTGIGLYLCKNLVELMGGEIYLNKSYNSGVPGNPGTSIEINLKRPPVSGEDVGHDLESGDESGAAATFASSMSNSQASQDFSKQELPETLQVLFVDDDNVLRKLFARSVKRVAPGWTMREASNGESALQLLDQGLKFDLIFVDQYMASIEKQLLGTETVLEMRAQGENCRLFGLSANDLEAEFIAAGADGFIIKPFPTENQALKQELLKAVYGKRAYYAKR